jgi:hypothetical protein
LPSVLGVPITQALIWLMSWLRASAVPPMAAVFSA